MARLALLPLLVACAGAPRAHPAAADSEATETRTPATAREVLRVDDLVVTGEETNSPAELLARAHWWWMNGNPERAVGSFELVFRALPERPLAGYALYWAALTKEQLGDHAVSAGYFEQVAARFPSHPWSADARLRALRLWGFLGNWGRAGTVARELLSRRHPWTLVERVALHSALSLSWLESGELERAAREIGRGRRLVDEGELDRSSVLPRDVAQLFFAEAELDRLRSAELHFDASIDFAQRFEARARLLLDAQAGYLDVMRAHDAHWTTLAGYRLSAMYQQLHAEVMQLELPAQVPIDRRELFRVAMRLRYLVLLEKATSLNARTLAVAERTATESEWVRLAQVQARRLRAALDKERALLDSGPFTRADLQKVLDEIQARQ